MISTSIKIFVDENEFDFEKRARPQSGVFQLDSETSVSKLKAHYFETLAELGEIVKFSRSDTSSKGPLSNALQESNSLLASFHEPPPDLACRLLQHTKGGLMLPGGFLGAWTFREATVSLVETVRQKKQIERAWGSLPLKLGVFAQRLATDLFFPAADRMEKLDRFDGDHCNTEFNLVYAGRLIPNKGISQLVRALNLWPISKIKLTLIGSYEPEFLISQAGVNCPHFESWFSREVLARNSTVSIHQTPPVSQATLAKVFRDSDVFLYPSFHEDEASGNAAHEAVLCGLPAIVTDWCGLGQLGRNNRGGALPTYATLGGVRYSLFSLRQQIGSVCSRERSTTQSMVEKDVDWVLSTYDPNWMRNSLRTASDGLTKMPVAPPLAGGWRCPDRLERIATHGPAPFRDAVSASHAFTPDGLYVDGTGYECNEYSEAHLLRAIQGLYTTWPEPPKLKTGIRLHGFWRVALWGDERALVELGFPGPRLLRFSIADWLVVLSSASFSQGGEVTFKVEDYRSAVVFQRAIDLGYLVPDDPMVCYP